MNHERFEEFPLRIKARVVCQSVFYAISHSPLSEVFQFRGSDYGEVPVCRESLAAR